MENPPKKFFRLAPGREVRLRYGYFITCRDVIKNAAGEVELRCTYDPATRGGNAPDGRKVKATIHWVSAAEAVPAEVRLYNVLFNTPQPEAANFAEQINPQSLEVVTGMLEPALASAISQVPCSSSGRATSSATRTRAGKLVFNRTVGLRDSYASRWRRLICRLHSASVPLSSANASASIVSSDAGAMRWRAGRGAAAIPDRAGHHMAAARVPFAPPILPNVDRFLSLKK
jgi:hypothetical protein